MVLMKYYGLDWLGAGPVGKSNFLSLNKALKNIYIYIINLTRLDDSRTVDNSMCCCTERNPANASMVGMSPGPSLRGCTVPVCYWNDP